MSASTASFCSDSFRKQRRGTLSRARVTNRCPLWRSLSGVKRTCRVAPHIGVLMGYPEGDKQAQAGADALRNGLQNLGWIKGRNIQIDYRWPGPDAEKARTLAKEL